MEHANVAQKKRMILKKVGREENSQLQKSEFAKRIDALRENGSR